jgi:hypothetical protein
VLYVSVVSLFVILYLNFFFNHFNCCFFHLLNNWKRCCVVSCVTCVCACDLN